MFMNGILLAEVTNQEAEKPQLEMRTYEVTQVHPFEDLDEGEFFKLSDDSSWMRTWWEGSAYHLEEGQTIAIIPMTEEEVLLHQKPPLQGHPYWIIINPKDDISVVSIAFKLTIQVF